MITIFTPLHAPGNPYVQETYRSLLDQTEQNWKWIVLENNGGKAPLDFYTDPRITVATAPPDLKGVGALKRWCCLFADTEYQLELDADDLLHPTALAKVQDAFVAGADVVYSDVAEFTGNYNPVLPYDPVFGWSSYLTQGPQGRWLNAMHQPKLSPQNLRYVMWSPNHVRAWRKDAYLDVGGHEAGMLVADDHDLMVRMYLAGKKFHGIEEALYFYRIHAENTVKTQHEAIQAGTNVVYNRYIWKLAEKFCDDNGLLKVDLCSWKTCPPGYVGWDKHQPLDADGFKVRLDTDLDGRWPADDSTVGLVRACDAIEHLKSPIHTMNEAFRVLAPGGFFLSNTPSTNGLGAWCDPTHVSFWNKLSFRYYTQRYFSEYISEFTGRFQELRVQEWFPDSWCEQNNLPYVEAHLVAQKEGYHHYGPNGWWPNNG